MKVYTKTPKIEVSRIRSSSVVLYNVHCVASTNFFYISKKLIHNVLLDSYFGGASPPKRGKERMKIIQIQMQLRN